MNKVYLFIMSISVALSATAQTGALDAKAMKDIRASFEKNDQNTALINAVSNNSLKSLALNRALVNKTDHLFHYRVKSTGITDQKQSGRCWMFTSLNVLRSKVMKHYNISDFRFSTNYLYFWDIFEKSNLFLQEVIKTVNLPKDDKRVDYLFKNVVGDGGVWNSFANLIQKYGAVPQSIMPETYHSEHTGELNKIIREKLRQDAITLREKFHNTRVSPKAIQDVKINMLKDIYRVLTLTLGVPPEKFAWRYTDKEGQISDLKEYTPLSFVKEALPNVDVNNYVLFMNDPTRPYHKLYEIDLDRNMVEGKNWLYINLPVDEIKKMAIASIKDNEAMYASCDVGKQLNSKEGLIDVNNYQYDKLLGIKLNMNKKQRIQTYQSGSSHGMALVAVDVDKDNQPVYWQFENSWGASSGHNGFLTFTDEWFNEYMFRVVILKKYVDKKTLDILKQKPTLLPPWDPMFQADK